MKIQPSIQTKETDKTNKMSNIADSSDVSIYGDAIINEKKSGN